MTLLDIPATADTRPEPKRDRWGRYLITHPDTGKEVAWTRTTTFAKTLADTFGLTQWELRMATLGLAKRADLLAQASTVLDPDDPDAKKLLNDIARQAKEAAGSSVRATLGTALHTMTEHIDAGRDFEVPDAHRADLDAYLAATASLVIDPEHIERIVTVPDYMVAGTLDRLVVHDGRLMVADLKTGRSLAGMGEYAIQLALYANADTMWDPATGTHEPMPDVDKERALIIWLPAGEARCELHEVDIAAGWAMAATCETVRAWRKRRDLSRPAGATAPAAKPATVEPPDVPVPTTRDEWVAGRITTLVASRAAKAMLAQHWPAGTPKRAPWTAEQIDAIVPVLERIESAVEAPFPHADPTAPSANDAVLAARAVTYPEPARVWTAPDDGPAVDDGDRVALKRKAAELPKDRAQRCAAWRAEGKRHGAPWGGVTADGAWSQRCWSDNRAALLCALHLWDDADPDALTRAALAVVTGEDVQPAWPTGALIGSLTVDQAERLADLASAFGANDPGTIAALGRAHVAAS